MTDGIIKKLKIKFIAIMMTVVVIFLAVIMVGLYISNKNNFRERSLETLRTALDDNNREAGHFNDNFGDTPPELPEVPDNIEEFPEPDINNGTGDFPMPEADGNEEFPVIPPDSTTPVLLAETDETGTVNIIRNEIFYLEDEDAEAFVLMAYNMGDVTGVLNDYNIRYMKEEISATGNVKIAVTDITMENTALNSQIAHSVWISVGIIAVMLILAIILSNKLIKPVEEAWNTQKQFVADASHELKTPLTVILSNTDMVINQGAVTDTKNAQRLDNIRAEAVRMKGLVNDLLTLARGDTEEKKTIYSEVDLSFIITGSLLTWEPVVFDMGKQMEYDVEEGIHIKGDENALRQLADILIDNALKYGKKETPISVYLKYSDKKNASRKDVIFSVTSEGTPISKDEAEKIFQRFYRADKSRGEIHGYGLGLSIAQRIACQHNAKLKVRSENDHSNTFYVKFKM